MAIIGWVMLVMESLLAAPLWAAAHAVPEGEGMSGQHGKQGYMLFLGVLMRPPLMVFGFFLAVVLMTEIGHFIGTQFGAFSKSMNATFLTGPITFIAMMFVIGSTMVVAAHKIFGLITWLPDTVLSWVGQQTQNLGEKEDESRTRMIFAAAGSTGGGVGGQAMNIGKQNNSRDNNRTSQEDANRKDVGASQDAMADTPPAEAEAKTADASNTNDGDDKKGSPKEL